MAQSDEEFVVRATDEDGYSEQDRDGNLQTDINSDAFDARLKRIDSRLFSRKFDFINWVRGVVSEKIHQLMDDGDAASNVIEFELLNILEHDLTYYGRRWLSLFGADERYKDAVVSDNHIANLQKKYDGLFDENEDEEAINYDYAPGCPLLHHYVMEQDFASIKNLVAEGADTKRSDNGGRTAYERALSLGYSHIADFLQQYPH